MTATWDKPWPFDPTSDLPPDGATAKFPSLPGNASFTFTFDAARGYWVGSVVAYPFSTAGIKLASIWAEGLS